MIKRLALILLAFNAFAQNIKAPEYIPLASQKVYDVEIIVFAYNKALPNTQTYRDKAIFDTSLAYELDFKPDDFAFIKQAHPQNTTEQYTIDIDKKESTILALAWFEHEKSQFQLNAIWNKLQTQESTIPLIHRAWRQPETPFETPQFVKISSVDKIIDDSDDGYLIYPDKSVMGQVALSKGRYLHFTNQINLFRALESTYEDDRQNMVFSLTEREQVKSGELHYFDNPWFGTLVKITQYKGKQNNEKDHD